MTDWQAKAGCLPHQRVLLLVEDELCSSSLEPRAFQQELQGKHTMSRQLSLFPEASKKGPKGSGDKKTDDLPADLPLIDEVLAVTGRFQHGRDLGQLIDFIVHFPQYSAFNGFLLFLQNPSATRVATARTWARKFKRIPAADARPLLILAPMAPVLFIFDVKDTVGNPLPPEPGPDRLKPSQLEKMYQTTLHNCALQAIAVHETHIYEAGGESAGRITPALRKRHQDLQLEKDNRYLILLDKTQRVEDKYAILVRELGHIFCGHLGIDRHAWWPERKDVNMDGEELEAGCVACLVCRRIELPENLVKYLPENFQADSPTPDFSLHAVLQAATYVEEMGKQCWRKPKKRGRY